MRIANESATRAFLFDNYYAWALYADGNRSHPVPLLYSYTVPHSAEFLRMSAHYRALKKFLRRITLIY